MFKNKKRFITHKNKQKQNKTGKKKKNILYQFFKYNLTYIF